MIEKSIDALLMTKMKPQAIRDSTSGKGSCVSKKCTTSANHGAAWANPQMRGGVSYDTRMPDEGRGKNSQCLFQR